MNKLKLAVISLLSSVLTSLALSFLAWAPAVAVDDFKKGCELYNAQQYKQALPIFEDTVKKFPKFWQGHYYLGHTYLALGEKSAARGEYEACRECNPGVEVAAACQKAMNSIGSGGASGAGSSGAVDISAGSGDDKKSLTPQERDLQENKAFILREARRQTDQLKAEMKEALDDTSASANRRFRRPDGTRYVADPVGTKSVEADYKERIKKINDDAAKKIEGLH